VVLVLIFATKIHYKLEKDKLRIGKEEKRGKGNDNGKK
jgi:hypothetical protein